MRWQHRRKGGHCASEAWCTGGLVKHTGACAAVAGYLVAPQCRGRWAGNGARVNTWSVGPYGQWDLEVQEANGQKPPRRDKSVVGLPLSISSPGRKTNCGGGFLAGGPSFQCRGPGGVSFDGSRANRWVLEQVRDRPHRFHIRLAANSGCGAAYLGAARKCGAPMEDPKLGLYNRDDPKAFTEFQLLPVAPCGFAGADCTHTGQCCEFQARAGAAAAAAVAAARCRAACPGRAAALQIFSHTRLQGFRCYSGKCATRPMPPDGSPFAVVEQGPPVSLDVDVPAPKNDGGAGGCAGGGVTRAVSGVAGAPTPASSHHHLLSLPPLPPPHAAITRYDVTLESADGGERISYASRSDVRACMPVVMAAEQLVRVTGADPPDCPALPAAERPHRQLPSGCLPAPVR